MKRLKFYETKKENGSIEWWTQRNERGVYFLIKRMEFSKKFRLFVNGEMNGAADYDSLVLAQEAANKKNNEMEQTKSEYTWDDLYERAIDCACMSPELRAKDHARFLLRDIILEEDGYDIEKCECAEEEIDTFLWKRDNPVIFDENGYLIRK